MVLLPCDSLAPIFFTAMQVSGSLAAWGGDLQHVGTGWPGERPPWVEAQEQLDPRQGLTLKGGQPQCEAWSALAAYFVSPAWWQKGLLRTPDHLSRGGFNLPDLSWILVWNPRTFLLSRSEFWLCNPPPPAAPSPKLQRTNVGQLETPPSPKSTGWGAMRKLTKSTFSVNHLLRGRGNYV